MEINEIKGKYAVQRERFLKENAPEMYEAMKSEGYLDGHIELVQNLAAEYIEQAVDKLKTTDEYKEAEESGDMVKMNKLINTAIVMAEYEAAELYVCSLPEDDEETDEGDTVSNYNSAYDDYLAELESESEVD